MKRWARQILLTLLLAGTGAASAETVKLTGTSFDLYYDSAYWDQAALNGDTITVLKPLDIIGVPGNRWYTEFASSLALVAHDGYALSGDFTVEMSGNYDFSGSNADGAAGISVGALVFGAAPDDFLGSFGADSNAYAADGLTGAFAPAGPTTVNVTPGQYTTVQINPILSLFATRLATAALHEVSFTAGVVPLTVVPEPETYAMLLSGLMLLGACAHKRRRPRC